MKEKEFLDYISRMKTDSATDQRIIDKVIHYDESENKSISSICHSGFFHQIKERFLIIRTIPKVAAVLLVVSVLGTVTALAASFIVKSYSTRFILDEEIDKDLDSNESFNSVIKNNIKGSKHIIDEHGVTVGLERIPDAAEEAFALIDLPNLVPSYLLDNYYTDNNGYIYQEDKRDDLVIKRINAYFVLDLMRTKEVFLWFDLLPVSQSAKDFPIYTDVLYETTTYVTKNGLICTIADNNQDKSFLSVVIMYDSEDLGNAIYRLEFSPNIELDEVKAVLESIPVTLDGIAEE